MKIGAEDKKKLIVMAVLMAIAIPLLIYGFGPWSGGSSHTAASVPATAASAPKAAIDRGLNASLDPRLRLDILETSRKVKYEPGRNIFRMEEPPPPPPVASVRPTGPTPLPTPTPTPPPPPIPLKFYGFASKPGETKKVFLQQEGGEQEFIASEGQIFDRRYKLIQIQSSSVVVEDMLNHNRQPIPLTIR